MADVIIQRRDLLRTASSRQPKELHVNELPTRASGATQLSSPQVLVVGADLAWTSELARVARMRLVSLSFCWSAMQVEALRPLSFHLVMVDAGEWPTLMDLHSRAVTGWLARTPVFVVTMADKARGPEATLERALAQLNAARSMNNKEANTVVASS